MYTVGIRGLWTCVASSPSCFVFVVDDDDVDDVNVVVHPVLFFCLPLKSALPGPLASPGLDVHCPGQAT